jgi:hypothetical protein
MQSRPLDYQHGNFNSDRRNDEFGYDDVHDDAQHG